MKVIKFKPLDGRTIVVPAKHVIAILYPSPLEQKEIPSTVLLVGGNATVSKETAWEVESEMMEYWEAQDETGR